MASGMGCFRLKKKRHLVTSISILELRISLETIGNRFLFKELERKKSIWYCLLIHSCTGSQRSWKLCHCVFYEKSWVMECFKNCFLMT